VSEIFYQLQNTEKYGSCMNNLGCIYLKKEQYKKSLAFLSEAIIYQQKCIDKTKEGKDKTEKIDRDTKALAFVNACRNYNKALSCYRLILSLINKYLPQHSLSMFVKKIPNKKQEGK